MNTVRRRRTWCWLLLVIVATVVRAGAQETSVTGRVELFSTESAKKVSKASSVVVWLVPASGTPAVTRQTNSSQGQGLRLVQKEKSFHPHLLVVEVGARVEFPNHDPFFHNVFSLFDGKRFDLGLYESGTTRYVQFDKPGISYIFCNIHAQMSAVIIALNTPYYGISNAHGDIGIPNVPPGRYELQVFHSSASPDELQALTREITITPGDSFIGTLRLEEANIAHAHMNKYGRDYDRPDPESPAYARP